MSGFLSEVFDPKSIMIDLECDTKEELFDELTGAIAVAHPECDQAAMLAALWEREEKLSTGIAEGIAIPHAICRGIDSMAGAIGISKSGIDYGALDDKPVHVVFMLAMGEKAKEKHLRTLNMIFKLAKSEALARILRARNPQEVHAALSSLH